VAKVKPKMIYASSKDELKKRLVGIACEIQGSDQGDVEYDEVCASHLHFWAWRVETAYAWSGRLQGLAYGKHACVASILVLLNTVESTTKC